MNENEKSVEQSTEKITQEKPKATSAGQGAGIFGITTETKATNNVPIPPVTLGSPSTMYPTGHIFPIARLANVISNPEFEKKDLSKVAVLQFVFKDKDGRQYVHTEWEVENSDAKFKEKIEGLNVRLKHLYTVVFNSFPEGGIGKTAKSFGEFFNMVADAFNSRTITKDEKTIKQYSVYDFFLKLVYYKDRLGFPLGPNFIEKVNPQNPVCKQLTINARYDHMTPNVTSGVSGTMAGLDDSLPDFDKSFEGFE